MRIPISRSAIPDWFDADDSRLLGATCLTCRCIFFPPTVDFCRNPSCEGETFEQTPLSRTGTVWSHTTNHYQPPAPYLSPKPFAPYTVAAVELAKEGMVVLGQVSVHGGAVAVGDRVRLVSEVLLTDDEGDQLVWRWTHDNESSEENE
ncbi:Zn-ribbon domain-containing OB-fold protein [Specibacter sp. RAF43]|uniref:Zn-ribbon domain-containing OB-fold protein n=1 Tax=Specibacter sp. RAF43 TaxID=3233057 RepID=UPI003F9D6169